MAIRRSLFKAGGVGAHEQVGLSCSGFLAIVSNIGAEQEPQKPA
jgi:hypothetical protein